jgi:hypothetical protein
MTDTELLIFVIALVFAAIVSAPFIFVGAYLLSLIKEYKRLFGEMK